MEETLEDRLFAVLSNEDFECEYFNESYTGMVALMKGIVEHSQAREELYEIGIYELKYPEFNDPDYFGKMNKYRSRQFGLEFTIKQILYDCQVPESYLDLTLNSIVGMMKEVLENEESKKQLYEINLNDYGDEFLEDRT
ncbi:hypothetical protein HOD29_06190 [archaeon]|jgi:hypothetical protein|nr:hypothetical protein [archaeon]